MVKSCKFPLLQKSQWAMLIFPKKICAPGISFSCLFSLSPEHWEWKENLAFFLYCCPFEKWICSLSMIFFIIFSNNKLKKAFQHLMTQLFSLESYPNITGLAPDLLVPSFQIAKTDCMCFYMLGLNDFRTVLCDKLTGINKYCNIWNGTKPWVTELASFLFFRFLFLFFVTCFEFGDKKKKKRPIFRAEW